MWVLASLGTVSRRSNATVPQHLRLGLQLEIIAESMEDPGHSISNIWGSLIVGMGSGVISGRIALFSTDTVGYNLDRE